MKKNDPSITLEPNLESNIKNMVVSKAGTETRTPSFKAKVRVEYSPSEQRDLKPSKVKLGRSKERGGQKNIFGFNYYTEDSNENMAEKDSDESEDTNEDKKTKHSNEREKTEEEGSNNNSVETEDTNLQAATIPTTKPTVDSGHPAPGEITIVDEDLANRVTVESVMTTAKTTERSGKFYRSLKVTQEVATISPPSKNPEKLKLTNQGKNSFEKEKDSSTSNNRMVTTTTPKALIKNKARAESTEGITTFEVDTFETNPKPKRNHSFVIKNFEHLKKKKPTKKNSTQLQDFESLEIPSNENSKSESEQNASFNHEIILELNHIQNELRHQKDGTSSKDLMLNRNLDKSSEQSGKLLGLTEGNFEVRKNVGAEGCDESLCRDIKDVCPKYGGICLVQSTCSKDEDDSNYCDCNISVLCKTGKSKLHVRLLNKH